MSAGKSEKEQKTSYASLAAIVYHIWKARNDADWNAAVIRPEIVIKCI